MIAFKHSTRGGNPRRINADISLLNVSPFKWVTWNMEASTFFLYLPIHDGKYNLTEKGYIVAFEKNKSL